MRFTNQINDLVVKFIRLDRHEQLNADMLVMERIYPIDFRTYEVERRELWLDVFEDELRQLHRAGFVHRYLLRPAGLLGDWYDNILLTNQGLRLIDVGISVLKQQVGDKFFANYVAAERDELREFRSYFLDR